MEQAVLSMIWINEWMNEQTNKWTSEWMNKKLLNEQMNERTNEWKIMLPVVTVVTAAYHGLFISHIHKCVQGNLDGYLFIQHNDNIHDREYVSKFQARGILVQKKWLFNILF